MVLIQRLSGYREAVPSEQMGIIDLYSWFCLAHSFNSVAALGCGGPNQASFIST